MNDTGRELWLLFLTREVFCVIKYILENLLNYPLTSSSTSWYRIILKLHTYCSIIQTADFVYLPLRFSPLTQAQRACRHKKYPTQTCWQPLATTNEKFFEHRGRGKGIFHIASNCWLYQCVKRENFTGKRRMHKPEEPLPFPFHVRIFVIIPFLSVSLQSLSLPLAPG